jgi:hypothetical protein
VRPLLRQRRTAARPLLRKRRPAARPMLLQQARCRPTNTVERPHCCASTAAAATHCRASTAMATSTLPPDQYRGTGALLCVHCCHASTANNPATFSTERILNDRLSTPCTRDHCRQNIPPSHSRSTNTRNQRTELTLDYPTRPEWPLTACEVKRPVLES